MSTFGISQIDLDFMLTQCNERAGGKKMPKNIVVFSDGTGQEGGKGHNTNVYKLFNMCEDRTDRQITFYDRGLGTGWRKLGGQAFGAGISKNIKECYTFIFDHYNRGDQIYLFGFSRGATTVRSLSSFIHLFGILPKSRPELIDEGYDIYKKLKTRDAEAKKFIDRHHNMWCRIQFLGVWDTVAALGIPLKGVNVLLEQVPGLQHKYQNLSMSQSVKHGRHALAIDDERKTFHPLLWDAEVEHDQTVEQVWFCGMHTDVGGGYPEQGLSDIPLEWIKNEAEKKGLLTFKTSRLGTNPNPNGKMHDSRGSKLARLYKRKVRTWDAARKDEPVVHSSVYERQEKDTDYKPWIMNKNPIPWTESL
jgi:uncharacterized protein (DUF2235 family)